MKLFRFVKLIFSKLKFPFSKMTVKPFTKQTRTFQEVWNILQILTEDHDLRNGKRRKLTRKERVLFLAGAINCVLYMVELAGNAYLKRGDVQHLLVNLFFLLLFTLFGAVKLIVYLKGDLIVEILDWCGRQHQCEAQFALDGWTEKLKSLEHKSWIMTVSWVLLMITSISVIVVIFGAIIVSLFVGGYETILPAPVQVEGSLTLMTFLMCVTQQSLVLVYFSFAVSLSYLVIFNGILFLYFRYQTIQELIVEMGRRYSSNQTSIDGELLRMIVDLQVDASR